jgi:tetratricopeptide (TPR) repeat protein
LQRIVSTPTLSIQEQAERWGAEAKRLSDSGRELAALDLYRKAADALPGAPWLQHRTAEVARKLKRDELAIAYFRRSAAAFRKAGFDKRAVSPLRLAWTIARCDLAQFGETFLDTAQDLSQLLGALGLHADAESTLEETEDALRRAGLGRLLQDTLSAPRSTTSVYPTMRPQSA